MPFLTIMPQNLMEFKESSLTKKQIHQLLEICLLMLVKSSGLDTCSKKSQDQLICSQNMLLIAKKSKDTMEAIILWVNN